MIFWVRNVLLLKITLLFLVILPIADDDDLLEFSKRQTSDDYGHLRFGKRGEESFDDYGHMRFGRSDN